MEFIILKSLKKKNDTIISIDEEKEPNKIQAPFLI